MSILTDLINIIARRAAGETFHRLATAENTKPAERMIQHCGVAVETYTPVMEGIAERVDEYSQVIAAALNIKDPEQAEGLRGELMRSAVAGFAMGAATATVVYVGAEEDSHASHRSHAKTDGE